MRAPVDAPELLRHADFVRAVARRLVLGEAQVDDVVQQTWLAALEHPPRRRGRLRAWLGAVARNFALRAAREARRRAHRERVAARHEAAPSAAETVAELAAHRRVVDAVLALDEPYRTAVLLRFYHGLPPREIARRTGVPGATARTRLHRALGLLRARLDGEHGGDRRAWCLALLPLARPPSALAAKLALVAALCGTATVAAVVAARGTPAGERTPERALHVAARVPDLPDIAPPDPTHAAPSGAPERPPARDEAVAPPGTIEGVLVAERGSVFGARAHLLGYRGWRSLPVPWHEEEAARHTHVDADGAFRFADLGPGAYAVCVERGGALLREAFVVVRPGEPTERVVFVLGGCRLRGRVFDELGRGAAGVRVYVSRAGDSCQNTWAWAGPDGSYVVDGLPEGEYWVDAQLTGNPRGDGNGLARRVDVAEGATATLDLGRVRPLPTWSGVVRNRAGEPVGPGRIQLNPVGARGYSYVAFDAEGRFRAPVLPDRYELRLHLAYVRFLDAGTVEVPETDLLEDVVVPGTRVRGRVRGAAGDRTVSLVCGDYRAELPLPADGTFVVDGLPGGIVSIHVDPRVRGGGTFLVDARELERVVEIEVEPE